MQRTHLEIQMSSLSDPIVSLSAQIYPLCSRGLKTSAPPSCSMDCFKHHNHPNQPTPIAAPTLPNGLPPKPPPPISPEASIIQTYEQGQPLSSSAADPAALKTLFRMYPQLRDLLHTIYASTLDSSPDDKVDQLHYRGSPERVAKRGRGRGRRTYTGRPWSQQRGRQNGLYTMRKIKDANTTDCEALRAFSTLVAKASPKSIAR